MDQEYLLKNGILYLFDRRKKKLYQYYEKKPFEVDNLTKIVSVVTGNAMVITENEAKEILLNL